MARGSGDAKMAAYDSEQGAKLSTLLKADKEAEEAKEAAAQTPPPLPTFTLSEAAQWDAFGIEQSQLLNTTTTTTHTNNFWHSAKGLRQRFSDTYGGENAARMLMDRGMTTFFVASNPVRCLPISWQPRAASNKRSKQNGPSR